MRLLLCCTALFLACGGPGLSGAGAIFPYDAGAPADGGTADGGTADGGTVDGGPAVAGLVSISLSQTYVTIPVGTMTAFAVTGTYANGSVGDVTQQAQASSTNSAVATVAHGQGAQIQITAVAQGSASIIVTIGSLQRTCAVTVTPR